MELGCLDIRALLEKEASGKSGMFCPWREGADGFGVWARCQKRACSLKPQADGSTAPCRCMKQCRTGAASTPFNPSAMCEQVRKQSLLHVSGAVVGKRKVVLLHRPLRALELQAAGLVILCLCLLMHVPSWFEPRHVAA